MIKQVLLLALPLLAAYNFATAQKSFKKSLSGITRVEIHSETSIELSKSSGNELVLAPNGLSDKEDEKASGLKPIYPGGTDNTGIGFKMEQKGATLILTDLQAHFNRSGLVIQLPSTVSLMLDCGSLGNAVINGWTAELEIKTNVGEINLVNVTGPITAHSSTGTIKVNFSQVNQTAPISIASSTGDIDVTLPESANASVELKSVIGGVFSAFDLVPARQDGLKPISGHKSIEGKINNGGVKISLRASTGNIYLRKK
ncbi:DUF4097 family beta strand repeat-containing protein [Flavihumibacter sp. CACIAM 22H1]|uniref:DUF4097 family beta strand repeat-containing protein n=1 Tax=Flavihumibacter sp. CACIAM 22H1 TaxID=1812911 RepID=UPI0007A85DDC|nr:DUF4097 family beta strand repeat-containing protein [Flavihumibacter sp. CACIAM 22H1]KYP14045.1 MAG: hypothetical protein A1D16_04245 [Flavihumibacter sp. CACIAM 22H1]